MALNSMKQLLPRRPKLSPVIPAKAGIQMTQAKLATRN